MALSNSVAEDCVCCIILYCCNLYSARFERLITCAGDGEKTSEKISSNRSSHSNIMHFELEITKTFLGGMEFSALNHCTVERISFTGSRVNSLLKLKLKFCLI